VSRESRPALSHATSLPDREQRRNHIALQFKHGVHSQRLVLPGTCQFNYIANGPNKDCAEYQYSNRWRAKWPGAGLRIVYA
jgi:hypothetical protein